MTPRIGTAPQVVMDARTVQDSKVVDSRTGQERNVRTGQVLSTSDSAAPRESYTGDRLPARRGIQPVYSTVGAQMSDYRTAMETPPSERRVPYLSNLGGNMSANSQAIANTKRPYNDLASAAYGSRFDPVIDNEPANRNLSYLQGQFNDPVDPISSVGENDVSIMMDRLRAQAGRRSGSRRN